MTTVFNPQEFLNRSHEGNFAIKRPTVPAGEYPGQLVEGSQGLEVKPVNTKAGVRFVLTLNWEVLDDAAKAATGLDKPRVRQDIWLDLDEHGRLINDATHNTDLGRVLSSLGLNTTQVNLAALRTVGLCKLKVTEDPDREKTNADGSPVLYNRVTAVTKFGGN